MLTSGWRIPSRMMSTMSTARRRVAERQPAHDRARGVDLEFGAGHRAGRCDGMDVLEGRRRRADDDDLAPDERRIERAAPCRGQGDRRHRPGRVGEIDRHRAPAECPGRDLLLRGVSDRHAERPQTLDRVRHPPDDPVAVRVEHRVAGPRAGRPEVAVATEDRGLAVALDLGRREHDGPVAVDRVIQRVVVGRVARLGELDVDCDHARARLVQVDRGPVRNSGAGTGIGTSSRRRGSR